MSKNIRLYPHEADALGLDIKPNEKGRKQAKYYLNKGLREKFEVLKGVPNRRFFVETVKKLDKNGNLLSSTEKLQSKPIKVPDGFEIIKISTSSTTGQQWVQQAPYKGGNVSKEVEKIDFEKIIAKYAKPIITKSNKKRTKPNEFDRLVYTDAHIGMTPNKNGHSLYGGKWDEDEIKERLSHLINHTLENKESDCLFVDELGDFMDGWDGETTRKGHSLPQNMDNEKAFDVGLGFKIRLIDALAPMYNKIVCNNICNDNHAGSFGYVVNKASKVFLEHRYSNVKVINHRKFLNHYTVGKNCFIITHGKDDKHLKFGFKPILDPKQIEKISDYIDTHELNGYNIEFSKGDSHQKIFDESTSDKFNYYNYGAFSPSSEWVQTNFKKGKSFFEFFNYKSDGIKTHHPYVFEWKVNRTNDVYSF